MQHPSGRTEVSAGRTSGPLENSNFHSSRHGVTVSELLALKWSDMDFTAGEINLCRVIVREVVGKMKTEASRKPLPLDSGLADVLMQWRAVCPYNQDGDYLFASPDKDGKQAFWPTAGMEKHIRPAAARAGINKRIGWHATAFLRDSRKEPRGRRGDNSGADASRERKRNDGQVRSGS
jgi:integrase